MDKEEVAAILDEIGTLLELQGENSFHCNAYHNGARAVLQLETSLADVIAQGKLDEVPGIGERLKEKITTLVSTGKLPYYEDLKAKVPAGLMQMMRVPGMGPKKVKALYDRLGIDDLDKLKAACEADQVASLKGFGAKTQQKILEGIGFLGQIGQRVRLDQADALVQHVLDGIRDVPGIIRMEVCGSYRRRKETIGDLDILLSAKDAGPIMQRFVTLPGVMQIVGQGDTKSTITIAIGAGQDRTV